MGAKLRLITNPIHWSLLLKPLATSVAWLFLPEWAFVLTALYCYFVPLFRPGALIAPFFVFLFLALAVPPGIFYAAFGAVVFGLLLAVKDLVIVSRLQAYQLLTLLLSFAGLLFLYDRFASWSKPLSFAALVGAVAVWVWLVAAVPERSIAALPEEKMPSARAAPTLLAALLLFEIGAVVFFLPLSFFSKAALTFFGSAVLYEVVVDPSMLRTKQILGWGLAYATIVFSVVFLADWKV